MTDEFLVDPQAGDAVREVCYQWALFQQSTDPISQASYLLAVSSAMSDLDSWCKWPEDKEAPTCPRGFGDECWCVTGEFGPMVQVHMPDGSINLVGRSHGLGPELELANVMAPLTASGGTCLPVTPQYDRRPLESFGRNGGVVCDTNDGPCSCGAWHKPHREDCFCSCPCQICDASIADLDMADHYAP